MPYPDTNLSDGEVDDPFGGAPADEFGGEAWAYHDAVLQEASRQLVDDQWAPRRFYRLTISTGGVPGDAVVFDSAAFVAGAGYAARKLASGAGYVDDVTPVIGILVDTVSANAKGRVVFAGILPNGLTGYPLSSAGEVTIDTSTGRLRAKDVGEAVYGYADAQGNVFLLAPGRL